MFGLGLNIGVRDSRIKSSFLIAQKIVNRMKNLKARMFNRKASDPRNKPDQIFEVLELRHGRSIADIGAGGGYFCLRFAEFVGGEGKVYAIDTNPRFLEFIERSAKERGLDNVETILASGEDLALPERSLDLVFMRNLCHHLTNRVQYFRNLRRFLKSEGRIAIVEYKRSKPFTFRGFFGHYAPRETIIEEMREAGYRVNQEFDFLPEQSFKIFSI
ncbi:MAG: class I SAM-dependent methyltransferase [Candidatus Bathyarchaeia archaeon]